MTFMTRAFSADVSLLFIDPGALPQAGLSRAPLALNAYRHILHKNFLFKMLDIRAASMQKKRQFSHLHTHVGLGQESG